MPERSRLARSLLRTGAFSLIGKGMGFLVPVAIAGWFGVGRDTDTFFISYAFVFFAVGVWGQGIEVAALPHLVRWRQSGAIDVDEEVRWSQGALLTAAFGCAAVLAAAFALVVLPSVRAVVSPKTAWSCLALLLPMFLATGGASLSAASLAADNRFALPALSQAFRALGVLTAALLLHTQLGVLALGVGYSAGEVLRLATLEIYRRRLARLRAATHPQSVPPGYHARRAWATTVWAQFGALALVNAGPLVERWVAAHTGTGAVTQIDYGLKLFAIPATIFDSSLAMVLLSHWSHKARASDPNALHRSTMRVVGAALVVATSISVVAIWQRQTIVEALLLRGRFDPASAGVVSTVFMILMLGFPLGMAALVFERAFMAQHRTRALLGVAGAKLAVRAGIAITMGSQFGVVGVAAAQPAASAVDLFLQGVLWRGGRVERDESP